MVESKSKPWKRSGGSVRVVWHYGRGWGDAGAAPRPRYQKSSRAAGRVADHILGRGLSQLDHQLNNVARCAKLAILSGGSDLREHVLVEIALGVAANHGSAAIRSTTLTSSAGVGMVKRASFMC